jgi:hypothetical protein
VRSVDGPRVTDDSRLEAPESLLVNSGDGCAINVSSSWRVYLDRPPTVADKGLMRPCVALVQNKRLEAALRSQPPPGPTGSPQANNTSPAVDARKLKLAKEEKEAEVRARLGHFNSI